MSIGPFIIADNSLSVSDQCLLGLMKTIEDHSF